MCELAKNHANYEGRIVKVRATFIGDLSGKTEPTLEDHSFNTSSCGDSYIRLVLVLPNNSKAAGGLGLIKDESFNKFQRDVSRGMRVDGLFEGRFHFLGPLEQKSKGNSPPRYFRSQLILGKITDVDSFELPKK